MTPEQRRAAVLARRAAAARLVVHDSDDELEELERAYAPVYGPPLVLTPYIEKVRRERVKQERPDHFDRAPRLPPLPPENIPPQHLWRYRCKRIALLPIEPKLPKRVDLLLPFLEEGVKTLPHWYQDGPRWRTINWAQLQWALYEAFCDRIRGHEDDWELIARLLLAGWDPKQLVERGVALEGRYWRRGGW